MVFPRRSLLNRFSNLSRTRNHVFSSKCSFTTSCTNNTATKPVVGILGGGISGLSVAFYVTKMYGDRVQTVLFEEQKRVGGWMDTVSGVDGGLYEMGPRTIRPVGIRGLNTLDLVEEVGLDGEVLFVDKSHDIVKNRFIYVNGELVKLPTDFSVLYKTYKPFSGPLYTMLLKDIFTSRKTLSDDSVHNFISRRFGPEIAKYLTDPLIRGIIAGDSKKVSIKFLMKNFFELEQKHGSIVIGTFRERFSKKKATCSLTALDKDIGFSKISAASLIGNWSVWGLENGMRSLPDKIQEWVKNRGVQVKLGCSVEALDKQDDETVAVKYTLDGKPDTIVCDHIVSSVGSWTLGNLISRSNVCKFDAKTELDSIEYTDLQVTGVRYAGDVLSERGFGFLVPSCENVGGLLGVVFDTNCFPQGDDTVVTIMSRGAGGRVEEGKDVLLSYVRKTLGIQQEPKELVSKVLRKCIPQYGVGHYEQVDKILKAFGNDRLSVCGNWVDGVSVNDCVYRGRVVAAGLGDRLFGAEYRGSEHVRASANA